MQIRWWEHDEVLGIAIDPEAAQARPFPQLHASLTSKQCRQTRMCGLLMTLPPKLYRPTQGPSGNVTSVGRLSHSSPASLPVFQNKGTLMTCYIVCVLTSRKTEGHCPTFS